MRRAKISTLEGHRSPSWARSCLLGRKLAEQAISLTLVPKRKAGHNGPCPSVASSDRVQDARDSLLRVFKNATTGLTGAVPSPVRLDVASCWFSKMVMQTHLVCRFQEDAENENVQRPQILGLPVRVSSARPGSGLDWGVPAIFRHRRSTCILELINQDSDHVRGTISRDLRCTI